MKSTPSTEFTFHLVTIAIAFILLQMTIAFGLIAGRNPKQLNQIRDQMQETLNSIDHRVTFLEKRICSIQQANLNWRQELSEQATTVSLNQEALQTVSEELDKYRKGLLPIPEVLYEETAP